MKNILVTGGAGFIGSNFVRCIIEKEPTVRVVNLDLLTYAGMKENISDFYEIDRHIFIHGDLCDKDLVMGVFDDYKIDTVVHFAAETHVDRSIEDPHHFVRTNVMGTLNLLEVARNAWKRDFSNKRFHHISTDEVYGDMNENASAHTELSPFHPRSPYAASKASADHLINAYFHTYGFPATTSLCSNNYGPCQFPEKLIPLSIINSLHGSIIPLYGDGLQIRDWVYVLDHCHAVYQILLHGRHGEFYNIAGRNQVRNIELVHKICSILDRLRPLDISYSSLITHIPDRPGHDRRYALDITKIQREVGWFPEYDIDAGLELTIKWYLENPHWVSAATTNEEYKAWLEKKYYIGRPSLK
jgi:dTDP-glucose 4,6-dehydratase